MKEKEQTHLALTILSIVATLLWLVYGHLRQLRSDEISLDSIGQSLACGAVVALQPAKLHRQQPTRPKVVVCHPFCRASSKKSVSAGSIALLPKLTGEEIRLLRVGLSEMKAINRTVNKFYYFANAESYEKARIVNRTFRKRLVGHARAIKLAPIYEDIAY